MSSHHKSDVIFCMMPILNLIPCTRNASLLSDIKSSRLTNQDGEAEDRIQDGEGSGQADDGFSVRDPALLTIAKCYLPHCLGWAGGAAPDANDPFE